MATPLSRDPTEAPPLVEALGVSLSFGRRNVLDSVDLAVRAGEIVTLIGLNGAGKSTLIRVILGIVEPDGGEVRRSPGLRIGYAPQHMQRDPVLPMTVQRFMTLGAPAPRGTLEALLDEVGADPILGHPLAEISGGEMRRVMLARALLREPRLLVLDEPMAGVDVTGQSDLYRLIADIRDRRGCGVLLVSHDIHLVMAATDTVVCLNRHVCCTGRPQAVLRDPEFISLFGPHLSGAVAVYRHSHDHRHDALGEPLALDADRARGGPGPASMTEDFVLRALGGGIGAALAAGPVGCFVVWRRMAYFGTALAHAVLLGVALGFLLDVEPIVAVFAICLLLAGCLVLLERQRLVSVDALLGVLAHAVFAAGLVVVGFMERVRVDLIGYLFGDILSVGIVDLWLIFGTAALVTAALAWQWRNLLAIAVDRDLAAAEGVPVERVRLLLLFLLAGVIAVGMKIVGMLLVVALVIVPAAAARRMSATPEQMAVAAAAIGVVSVAAGLFASLEWDVAAGPAIVLVASAIFAASLLIPARGRPRGLKRGRSCWKRRRG